MPHGVHKSVTKKASTKLSRRTQIGLNIYRSGSERVSSDTLHFDSFKYHVLKMAEHPSIAKE